MAEGGRRVIDDEERRIRLIRDPELKVKAAVEAHQRARVRVARMSDLRRDALLDLKEAGLTWAEVAEVAGMTTKAVVKVAHGSGQGELWWKRIPDEVAAAAKLGPGGIPREQLVPKADVMEATLKVMSERERAASRSGPKAVPITPGQLREGVIEKIGREVGMPSLRSALNTLLEQGSVVRVGHGRYALKERVGAARRAADRRRPGQKAARRRS